VEQRLKTAQQRVVVANVKHLANQLAKLLVLLQIKNAKIINNNF